VTARPEPFPVAASTPAQTPPSGGDWIPVSTDGAWWWDGRRWETTVQSPWPTPPTVVLVGPAGQRGRRSGAALLATVVALPFRVAWFLLRPVASMVVGLASVVAVLVLVAVLVAHSLH
jgi:hypothetical protein